MLLDDPKSAGTDGKFNLEELAAASKALKAPRNLDLEARLKECFGYDRFRPGQREIVEGVLAQRRQLAHQLTPARVRSWMIGLVAAG